MNYFKTLTPQELVTLPTFNLIAVKNEYGSKTTVLKLMIGALGFFTSALFKELHKIFSDGKGFILNHELIGLIIVITLSSTALLAITFYIHGRCKASIAAIDDILSKRVVNTNLRE
ncbi:MAG: hypothetical protein HAW67_05285 [Endozoicomonadaceae bacterium]|nr:hypothetical protein [Endozoicomonadaceae bacterium]